MIRTIELAGTSRAMGRHFGEAFRAEISELYALRVRNALTQAQQYGGVTASESDLRAFSEACLASTRPFDPDGFAELEGIAEGAGLPIASVMALGGLTDLRDGLAWGGHLEATGGCSSCLVPRASTREHEVLAAQTWDLQSENMPFVVAVKRRPEQGPRTASVTTVGCLSLIAINEDGLAIGTTNLRTLDARVGVPYLSLIHKALACPSLEAAAIAIEQATRAGGHYYWLADARGRGLGLECSATRCVRSELADRSFVHCNHALEPAIAALEGKQDHQSSHARHTRLEELFEGWDGDVDAQAIQSFLGDEAGGVNAICRHDYNGISTNAAAVALPERGELLACQGYPCEADWERLVPAC